MWPRTGTASVTAKWTHIDGWSEAVVDYIERFEHLDTVVETA